MKLGVLVLGCVSVSMASLVACAPSEEDVSGGGSAVSESAEPEAAPIKVGNITVTTKRVVGRVKASSPPDEFSPEFDSCSTNVTYFQIAGTEHDAAINKILRGEWKEPTTATCEAAESFDSTAVLRGLDPDQGLLSLTEFESFFSGGAHPNNGTEFKTIDLRSGKLVTLADYVKEDSSPKLAELVKHKIETQKVKIEVDPARHDRGGRGQKFEIKLLPAEDQEMMKGFADSYFTTFESGGGTRPSKASEIQDFTIAGTGIRVDLSNNLPHAFGGMDASYKLLWKDLETAGVLRTDTDLPARTKASRPKQLK